MTEERMIRVTKPEALDGEVSIRVFFDYYRPDGRLAKDGFTINDFDGLEPAPPKDWKPFCFDEYTSADDDFCPGVHQTNWMGYIQPELEENCVECIHRKKKEYEK